MDIKILVATHLDYKMPKEKVYLPIQVGKSNQKFNLGHICDNTGENISKKNCYYSELTGLYWAWKNIEYDYLGVSHYRRHFSVKKRANKWESIATTEEINNLCKKYEIIVPVRRKYYIETNYSHYKHTFDESHLIKTRNIISKQCPDYLTSFDKVMKKRSAHMFNMFIMSRRYIDEYCEWLFKILEELILNVDISKMTPFQIRFPSRISEILFDVWLEKNKLSYKEINYVHLTKTNWLVKGGSFLLAKFFNKKYKESF